MRQPPSTRYDAVVIGAGLIGLSCAWRAARPGLSVLVVDRDEKPAGAASAAWPPGCSRRSPRPTSARRTCWGSTSRAARWPAFAAELEELTGMPTGYGETGALVVAADRDDAEALRRLHDFQRELGLDGRVALALALPGARAGALAADRRRHPRAPGRPAPIRAPRRGRWPRWSTSRLLGVEARGDRARRQAGDRGAHGRRASWTATRWWWPAGAWSAALAPGGEPARAAGEGADPGAARARRMRTLRCDRDRAHAALLPASLAATAAWCWAPPWRSRASTPP